MTNVKLTPSTTSSQLIQLCNELNVPLNQVAYRDQIKKLKNNGYIINLHKSTDTHKDINHWCGFYAKNGLLAYFDSFGCEVPDNIIRLAKKEKKRNCL